MANPNFLHGFFCKNLIGNMIINIGIATIKTNDIDPKIIAATSIAMSSYIKC